MIIGLATIVLAVIFWRQVERARLIVTSGPGQPLISAESYPIPSDAATPLLGNPGAPLTLGIRGLKRQRQ